MKKEIYSCLAVFLFTAGIHLRAQEGISKKVDMLSPPKIVNFKQLSDYELAHPHKHKRHAIEQGEDREKKFKFRQKPLPPGARSFNVELPSPANPNERSYGPVTQSPSPEIIFNGILDNESIIPPDIEGAAGPAYLMEVTNQEFDIFDKNGTLNSAITDYTLFTATGGSGYFDPHVVYDHTYGRYLICTGGYLSNGHSGVFLAVSQTSDPTGNWYVYSHDGTGNSNDLLDFPLLGYNTNWVVITGNDFSGNNEIGKLFVFNRSGVYSGSAGTVTNFVDSNSVSMSPAQTYDASETTEYLVEDYDGDQGGSGYMQIPTITGTANAPVYSPGNTIGVNHPWDETASGAPQKGSTETLEDGDTRVGGSSVYTNGTLWFSHTVFLPAGAPTHDAVDWWQVNPATVSIQQYGRIEDTTGVIFYFYPSINVNAIGDALLGYCESGSDMYASSSYSFHAATDAANVMESTYIFKPGLASYFKDFGTGRNRWGDFTGAAMDPTDNSFWDFNEWANTNNNWATEVANVLASGSTACLAPSGTITTNITDSSATLSWDSIPNDSIYYIQYQVSGNSSWITDSTAATHFNLKNLAGSTLYNWQVQSKCSFKSASLYTAPITFLTLVECDVSSPVSSPATICTGDSAVLTAAGADTIFWFVSDTASTPISTGSIYKTPPLLNNTTYYTKSVVTPPLQHVGPPDSTFGTATIFTSTNYHDIIFNCFANVRLVSVKVYAQGAGDRTITLEDELGNTLASETVDIPNGTSRVTLNFDLPIDNNLELGLAGNVNLLRNNAGASYPYTLQNVISLIGSNASGLPGYYYYFYDWEIQEAACNSARAAVSVNVVDPVSAFSFSSFGDSVTFINQSTGTTGWFWSFGDGDTSSLKNPIHTYAGSGSYSVMLVACGGNCCDTSYHTAQIIATGIADQDINKMIKVFPNPVKDNVQITFVHALQSTSCVLKLINSIGEVIADRSLSAADIKDGYTLNTFPFAAGVYTLTIQSDDGKFIQKIIKE